MRRAVDSRRLLAVPLLVTGAVLSVARPSGTAAQLPPAQGSSLSGIVTDTLGQPLSLAAITDEQGRLRGVADDSGRFRIVGLTGRVTLVVKRMGYRPVRLDTLLPGEGPVFLLFRLVPLPLTLAAEEITASSQPANRALERLGFYQRMRDKRIGALTGTFITPEELERRPSGLISMTLHAVPGIRLRPKNSDPTQWVVEGRGGCEMAIWIDGQLVQKGQATGLVSMTGGASSGSNRGALRERAGIDQLIVGTEILAIEVYPSAVNLPLRFQNIGNANCGVIAIWTKR